jgi:transaldolase
LIKVAATWEGISAAAALERRGIHTNLTLLFSFVQAVACAQAKVQLISPFVGRIYDWYKKSAGPNWVEADHRCPGPRCAVGHADLQLLQKFGIATEVMGASFRNVGQITALAGCDLLTISPDLLANWHTVSYLWCSVRWMPDKSQQLDLPHVSYNEPEFRLALNQDAMATEKLAEGIRAFCLDAIKLDQLLLGN